MLDQSNNDIVKVGKLQVDTSVGTFRVVRWPTGPILASLENPNTGLSILDMDNRQARGNELLDQLAEFLECVYRENKSNW